MTEEKIRISKEIANELVETILLQIRNGIMIPSTLKMMIDFEIRGILDKYVVVDKGKLKNKLEVTTYEVDYDPTCSKRYKTGLIVNHASSPEEELHFGEDFIKNEVKNMFVSVLENLED